MFQQLKFTSGIYFQSLKRVLKSALLLKTKHHAPVTEEIFIIIYV